MTAYIGEIISGAVLVLVSIIEARAAGERRERAAEKATNDRRAELRAKESSLSMQMQSAALDLADATAIAVQQGKCNGELVRARLKAQAAQEEYEKFLREIGAKETTKI